MGDILQMTLSCRHFCQRNILIQNSLFKLVPKGQIYYMSTLVHGFGIGLVLNRLQAITLSSKFPNIWSSNNELIYGDYCSILFSTLAKPYSFNSSNPVACLQPF